MKMVWKGNEPVFCRREYEPTSDKLLPNVIVDLTEFQIDLITKKYGKDKLILPENDKEPEKIEVIIPKDEPKENYDLNKDGKVDKKDIKIMAKGLRSIGSKLKKKKVKK